MSRQEILSLKTYEPYLTSGRDYTSVCRRGGHRTTNTSRVSGAEKESGDKKKKHRGCVYILSNPSIPNLLKIGYTSKTARERAKEIDSTGVPTPFHVEYEAFVSNPKKTERKVHEILVDKRENDKREFFKCSIKEAVSTIRTTAKTHLIEEYYYKSDGARVKQPRKNECDQTNLSGWTAEDFVRARNNYLNQKVQSEINKQNEEVLGSKHQILDSFNNPNPYVYPPELERSGYPFRHKEINGTNTNTILVPALAFLGSLISIILGLILA